MSLHSSFARKKKMTRISWICLIAKLSLCGLCCGGEGNESDDVTRWISDKSLADFRSRAATREPDFEAFGWAVFKFEKVFFGVLRTEESLEFVATAVTEMKTEVQLSGRSQIILNQKKRIFVPDEATVKLNGDEYEISGGRSRLIIGIPGANKTE